MSNKGISVVIPNYNGKQLLEQILPPLIVALEHATMPYEIILSDDASTDESIIFLQSHYPQVKLIGNKQNQGFSPTINKGIFAAQLDYVLLLNSDVKLTPGYFKPLLRYFDREDTFGVMGRIEGWDEEKLQDAAKYPSFHGVKIKTSGNYYAAHPQQNDWLYSMYLSGANALVDRKKLVSLGGFNELFAPFYVEDFDLSLRAWRLGWKCYYEHFAVCQHKTSVSIKSKSSKYFIKTIYYRNKMYLHFIHLSGAQLIIWFLQLIPETLFSIITGKFYFIASLQLFFLNKNKALLAKKELQNLSKKENMLLSVKEVAGIILHSLKDTKIIKF